MGQINGSFLGKNIEVQMGLKNRPQMYKVFIKYCVFALKCCDFFNSANSAAALVFYLPFSGPCTQLWKTESGQSMEYILKFSKKTAIFNEHPVIHIANCTNL